MKKESIQNKEGLDKLEADLEQFLKREEAQLERTHKSYARGKPPDKRKSFFRETRVGRFLSGRTKAGRIARRTGLAALGLGGLSVAGVGPEPPAFTSQGLPLIDQLNELVLMLGGLLTALSHLMDKLEQYQRVTREREDEHGEIPAIKKVLRAIAHTKEQEQQHTQERL